MIDPLLRKKKDHTELAESWSDDPWDLPSALGKAMDVESDVVKAELRHFSRPLGLAVLIVAIGFPPSLRGISDICVADRARDMTL